jgi:Gpi18-like mannosyltransferase
MSDWPPAPATSRPFPLGPWLLLAMALNLVALPCGGFESDLECWANWTTHLQQHGFADYPANYPPLYIHWLWVVAKFHSLFGIPVGNDLLLKLLALTPVFAAQLGLLAILHRILLRRGAEAGHSAMVMAAAALNPAFYMNGPVWGQVDLVFSLPVALALAALFEGVWLHWVLPLLAIAFLLKFQSIAVAPAFAGLLWIRRRDIVRGLLPCLAVVTISILPFVVAGSLGRMIDGAYLSSASTYPLATYNAANLWYLLGLNVRPDVVFLLDPTRVAQGMERLLTPKALGMASYFAFGIWIVVDSLRVREPKRWWRNSLLSILGFFLLLPAMHERYLFLAIPVALVASAYHPSFLWIAALLSFFNLFNTILIMPPHGGIIGPALAACTLLFALGILLKDAPSWDRALAWASRTLSLWLGGSVLLWAVVTASLAGELIRVQRSRVLPGGWINATQINGRASRQSWGSLHIDQSVDGNLLRVGDSFYAFGFGTHANSVITIPVPAKARSFRAKVGVDDESKNGHVEFEVVVDGVSAWKSGPVDGGHEARACQVTLTGSKVLELKVDALGVEQYDHADWLDPVFEAPP